MLVSESPVEESDFERLSELIAAKSGLEFPPSRRPQLEAAIRRKVEQLGLPDPRHLWERLIAETGRIELEDFIASLTIGETYFFRNEPHFEALERHVLPQLIERRRHMKRLRLWSAGCSSGEEPYSLAMLLDRLLPDPNEWDLTILATDIDREALAKASAGVYRSWSLRRTADEMRARYFERRGGEEWELDPRIRRMVDFRYLNLVDDVYPSLFTNIHQMDLVICRNVLIYFGHLTAAAVAEKLRAALADEGWLVPGHAELSKDTFAGLAPRNFPGAVLYEKEPFTPRRRSDVRPSHTPTRPARRRAGDQPTTASRAPVVEHSVENRKLGPPQRRLDDALHELEREASEHPDDPRPTYLLAKLHADRLAAAEAARWIAEALTRDELFAPAHYIAGLIAEEEARWSDAITALRRSTYADPRWPLPYVALARCFSRAGRERRAEVALTRAIGLLEELAPNEPIAEGDGLTAGRLLELARIQREISEMQVSGGSAGAG